MYHGEKFGPHIIILLAFPQRTICFCIRGFATRLPIEKRNVFNQHKRLLQRQGVMFLHVFNRMIRTFKYDPRRLSTFIIDSLTCEFTLYFYFPHRSADILLASLKSTKIRLVIAKAVTSNLKPAFNPCIRGEFLDIILIYLKDDG